MNKLFCVLAVGLMAGLVRAELVWSTMDGGATSVKDTWSRDEASFRMTSCPMTSTAKGLNPVTRSKDFSDYGTVCLKSVEMVGRSGEGDWKPSITARLYLNEREIARSTSFAASAAQTKTVLYDGGKTLSHVGYTFTFALPRVDVTKNYTLRFYDGDRLYKLGHTLVDISNPDGHRSSNTAAMRITVEPDPCDISRQLRLHSVVAAGTLRDYQGHPTSVRTPDGRIIAVWTNGHGGHFRFMAESLDGGRTWKHIENRLPKNFLSQNHRNCPSIYAMKNPRDGKTRLWVFSQYRRPKGHGVDWMPRVVSEDWGKTWTEAEPLGKGFECVMTFASTVQLKDGAYLGVWHRNAGETSPDRGPRSVYGSVSRDGGLTWEKPRLLVEGRPGKGQDYCEPCVFRSPTDPDELCMLLREQSHDAYSKVVYSRDEGTTWTAPVRTSAMLTGERHACLVLPDGRLAIAFRDMELNSRYHGTDFGHFVLWIGTYGDLKSGEERGRKLRLLTHFADRSHRVADCGYPGLTLAPNGDIEAMTYVHYRPGREKNSVVLVRVPRSVYAKIE